MQQERSIALLTGASSGIGRQLAERLLADGSTVHVVGRDLSRLEALTKSGAHAHSVDLTVDDGLVRLVTTVTQATKRLDLLLHCAGDIALGTIAEAPVEDLDRQYRINLRVPFLLTQKLLPVLREAAGQVVFINSGAGQNARPNWGQYAMTKHGLRALADSLREEVAGDGIRVLSVYPGRTATPMQQEVHHLEGKDYDPARFLDPTDVASQILVAVSQPARATVTEITIRPTGR